MKRIPKAELHLHLGGSYPIEYLTSIASKEQIDVLNKRLDKFDEGGVSYSDCFDVFDCVSNIVNTIEKVENGIYALCQDLQNDGVTYVEIRTGIKDMGTGYEGYLQSLLQAVDRFDKDQCANSDTNGSVHSAVDDSNGSTISAHSSSSKLIVRILLSLRRHTTQAIADITLQLILKYRHLGVIGLDISGDSTLGDGEAICSIISSFHQHKIPITLHIGESKEETLEQQMKEMLVIKPNRIGHGVHLYDEVRKYILQHKIPIEMCLSSALKAGMIDSMTDHPALPLISTIAYSSYSSSIALSPSSTSEIDGGADKSISHSQEQKACFASTITSSFNSSSSQNYHPVVICTDDPLIFRTSLSQECQYTADILQLSEENMMELQSAAFQYAFINYHNESVNNSNNK